MDTDTTMTQADHAATLAAAQHCLPQTVYRDVDSGGWWHTHALAEKLSRAELGTTWLPARYFN